jgi:hypothetical protein
MAVGILCVQGEEDVNEMLILFVLCVCDVLLCELYKPKARDISTP